jgi:hypothetical protein
MSEEEVIFTTPQLKSVWTLGGGGYEPRDLVNILFLYEPVFNPSETIVVTGIQNLNGTQPFNKIFQRPNENQYTLTVDGDNGLTRDFEISSFVFSDISARITVRSTLSGMKDPFVGSKTISLTLTRKTQPLKLGATAALRSTPPAAVVLPTLYFDLSCWADTAAVPAISGGFVGNSNTNIYTVDKCYQRALTKGHDLFALQSGYKCYTGRLSTDNYKIHGAVTDSSQCTATGGTLVNHVYSVNSLSFVAPHDTIDYSSRSSAPALYSDFKDQTLGLVDSLSNVAMSNPAPFMTAMDADINSLRDSVTIEKLRDENSQTILDATRMFEEAMDMSGVIQDGSTKSERLRREIVLTANQQSMYQKFLIPLQILGVTLILAVIAGSLLPVESSSFVLVILVIGFAFTLYFSLANNRNHK